jgi:hypothetical protein
LGAHPHSASLDDLRRFREAFYDCLLARADALFELTDALLCVEGAVKSLVELTLTAEQRTPTEADVLDKSDDASEQPARAGDPFTQQCRAVSPYQRVQRTSATTLPPIGAVP